MKNHDTSSRSELSFYFRQSFRHEHGFLKMDGDIQCEINLKRIWRCELGEHSDVVSAEILTWDHEGNEHVLTTHFSGIHLLELLISRGAYSELDFLERYGSGSHELSALFAGIKMCTDGREMVYFSYTRTPKGKISARKLYAQSSNAAEQLDRKKVNSLRKEMYEMEKRSFHTLEWQTKYSYAEWNIYKLDNKRVKVRSDWVIEVLKSTILPSMNHHGEEKGEDEKMFIVFDPVELLLRNDLSFHEEDKYWNTHTYLSDPPLWKKTGKGGSPQAHVVYQVSNA